MLVEARARALMECGRPGEAVAEMDRVMEALQKTDLGHIRTLLESFRHACLPPAQRKPADVLLGEARRLVHTGHRLARAEALFRIGAVEGDRGALREAGELARQLRHKPLQTRVEETLEALGPGADSAMGEVGVRRLNSLERLKEVTKIISREMDGGRLLRLVLDQAVELTSARRGFLILLRGSSISIPVARKHRGDGHREPPVLGEHLRGTLRGSGRRALPGLRRDHGREVPPLLVDLPAAAPVDPVRAVAQPRQGDRRDLPGRPHAGRYLRRPRPQAGGRSLRLRRDRPGEEPPAGFERGAPEAARAVQAGDRAAQPAPGEGPGGQARGAGSGQGVAPGHPGRSSP